MKSETQANLILAGICLGLFFIIVLCVNSCSSVEWNDGICPNCNVRYELRAVDRGAHYYVCPNCGNEVRRY